MIRYAYAAAAAGLACAPANADTIVKQVEGVFPAGNVGLSQSLGRIDAPLGTGGGEYRFEVFSERPGVFTGGSFQALGSYRCSSLTLEFYICPRQDIVLKAWSIRTDGQTISFNVVMPNRGFDETGYVWYSGDFGFYGFAYSDPYTPDSVGMRLTLTSVPEPATWAMMIAGFGLIGAAARRRSSANLAAI